MNVFLDVYVVDAENVPLLVGADIMKHWKVVLDMGNDTISMNLGKDLKFKCETTPGGHKAVKLFKSGEWTTNETVFYMAKEEDIHTFKKIKKIHEVTNHKSENQLLFAYRIANKLTEEVRKTIKRAVENCKVCQKFKRSQGRPKSTLLKLTDLTRFLHLI